MKRGEVAESDDRTRIAANGLVVDAIEDAHRAVAASSKEEGVELIRVEKLVELFEALFVGAGEIASMTVGEIGGQCDVKALRFQAPLGHFDAFRFGGRRDREYADVRGSRESPRRDEG